MSVWQSIPWPSIPERDHLVLRLVLLSFRGELSGCRRGDGGTWSNGQLRNGPALVRQVRHTVRRWPEKTTYSDRRQMASGRGPPENQWRPTLFMACSRSEKVSSLIFWSSPSATDSQPCDSSASCCVQAGVDRASLLPTNYAATGRRNES